MKLAPLNIKFPSVRRGNALLAAIFIMAILMILGTVYSQFGVNTKNIIRRSYIDQIAIYVAEAAMREMELNIRMKISDPNSDVIQGLSGASAKDLVIENIPTPTADSLANSLNLQGASGGKVTFNKKVFFDGFDSTKEIGGCYGKEKTGNVRFEVITKFSKSVAAKKLEQNTKLMGSMDFKMINLISKYEKENFRPNPFTDYLVWARNAGIQNVVGFGQVMNPKGVDLELDFTPQPRGKIFMGSGAGFENNDNEIAGNISLQELPIYVNVDQTQLPVAPSPQIKDDEPDLKPDPANTAMGLVPNFCQKVIADILKDLKDNKADSSALNDARTGITDFYTKTKLQVVPFFIPIWNSAPPTSEEDSQSTIINSYLTQTQQKIKDFLKTALNPNNNSEDEKVADKRENAFSISSNDRSAFNATFQSLSKENFTGAVQTIGKSAVNSYVHSYAPVKFKGKPAKLEGNFRKRFFQAAFLWWNTRDTPNDQYSKELKKAAPEMLILPHHPFSEIPGGLEGDEFAKVLKLTLERSNRKSSWDPTNQPYLLTSMYNTDYQFNFDGTKTIHAKAIGHPLFKENESETSCHDFVFWEAKNEGKNRCARYASWQFKSQDEFKDPKCHFYQEGSSDVKVHLKGAIIIDGTLEFPKKPVTFLGKGMLIVIGDIIIQGDLSVAEPGKDYAFLYSKTPGGKSPAYNIIIKEDVKIRNISLIALSDVFVKEGNIRSSATIRTGGKTLDLVGNYIVDRVGWSPINGKVDDPDHKLGGGKNIIKMDPNLLKSDGPDVYSLTMAARLNEWYFASIQE